jgi:hypothetical protein
MQPLALTDSQLDAIHRAAWPLAPADAVRSLKRSRQRCNRNE